MPLHANPDPQQTIPGIGEGSHGNGGGVPPTSRADGGYVDELRRQRDRARDEVAALRRELTELRIQTQANWYAACHDELTGLPNRRALYHHGTSLRPADGDWIACAVIDLDGFKTINDRYGHRTGDTVLIEIGRRLAHHCTALGRFAARLGGDEFVMIWTGTGSLEPRLTTAAAGLAGLFDPALPLPGGQRVTVTASIGVAACHTRTPLTGLLDRADAALYEAKRQRGRHTACVMCLDTATQPQPGQPALTTSTAAAGLIAPATEPG